MTLSRIGPWARWAWLAVTVALGATLMATAWAGRQRVVRAATTLNRGQGEVMLETLRQSLRNADTVNVPRRLDSLLAEERLSGLRYVAVFGTGGALVGQSGQPLIARVPDSTTQRGPPDFIAAAGRIRVSTGVFLRGAAPPPPDSVERRRVRPLQLVFEFEPVIADQLSAEATRTALLSVLVASALVAISFVFWRLSLAQEAAERRLEHQRRLGVLGEMSAVLAHEIRNPLASLKGHAQLLAEHLAPDTPDGQKAALVVREAQRIEALTTDLLAFARSGAIDRQPTDPAALVRTCIQDIGGDNAFALRSDTAPASWPLDAHWMRQAVTNVLRNAMQASPGTRSEVTVSQQDDVLLIAVRDHGPGIKTGEASRIFAPFYTTRTSGTGLGLAVAQRVAEMHGGAITARNEPSGGAVFRFAIPRL